MFEVKVKLNHGISDEDFSKQVIRDIIENNKSPVKQDCIILRLYFVFLIQLTFELKCAAAYA